jgi:hypothetical protein
MRSPGHWDPVGWEKCIGSGIHGWSAMNNSKVDEANVAPLSIQLNWASEMEK